MQWRSYKKLGFEFVTWIIFCEHPGGDPAQTENRQVDYIYLSKYTTAYLYLQILPDQKLQMRTNHPACLKTRRRCN